MNYDVVIIGAGASGLMCAAALKINKNDLNVLVLEKNDKVGKKLSITGNGKCNLGNTNDNISHYHSDEDITRYKKYIENDNYLNYLKQIGILLTNEEDRIYPHSMQAISVCKSFERFLIDKDVKIKYNYEVNEIKKENNVFIINNDITSKYVVVATGGISYPKTGSTGDGYEILKGFNHNISQLYPSLTCLKTNYKYIKELQGVRANAVCKLLVDQKEEKIEKGQVQFTKDSLSGICIFNLSRNVKKHINANKKIKIVVDLMPEKIDLKNYLKSFPNYKMQNALSCVINNKIAFAISKQNKVLDKLVKDVSDSRLEDVINTIYNMEFEIIDTGNFDNAQVTNGGALISEFDDGLKSKLVNNLYVIGEVLNVDGDCGGYNLAWAFKSAIIVANNIVNLFNNL